MDNLKAIYGLLILAAIPYIVVLSMVASGLGDSTTYALIIGGSNTAVGVIGGVLNSKPDKNAS